MTQSYSRVAARRNVYRKTSGALGLISGGFALVALPYVYFLLTPALPISAILMIVGGVLIWTRNTMLGALLILVGGLFGGFYGLPWLLWTLLAPAFGNWVYGLPLLPLGLLLPIASFVLAFMSREPSKA
jgi:hypothetical protein